jgi:hypothetical protein
MTLPMTDEGLVGKKQMQKGHPRVAFSTFVFLAERRGFEPRIGYEPTNQGHVGARMGLPPYDRCPCVPVKAPQKYQQLSQKSRCPVNRSQDRGILPEQAGRLVASKLTMLTLSICIWSIGRLGTRSATPHQ